MADRERARLSRWGEEDVLSGVVGIRRRVEAHDGSFTLDSPAGGPTVLNVTLPCGT
ncbi:hypothetical protein ACIBHY_39890 [Nonomuraea sp. NPDC050547]|uniref:hypothetical protein n=1 Tax=Nonomuraea sp. NPDC050547 TaxID=3364368 RepID=UPI0037A2EB2C